MFFLAKVKVPAGGKPRLSIVVDAPDAVVAHDWFLKAYQLEVRHITVTPASRDNLMLPTFKWTDRPSMGFAFTYKPEDRKGLFHVRTRREIEQEAHR